MGFFRLVFLCVGGGLTKERGLYGGSGLGWKREDGKGEEEKRKEMKRFMLPVKYN